MENAEHKTVPVVHPFKPNLSGTISIKTTTGEVMHAEAYSATEISGGGGTISGNISGSSTAYGGYVSGSVGGYISPIVSTVTHHQKLVLKWSGGLEESRSMEDSPIQFRPGGKVVSIAISTEKAPQSEYGIYSVEQDQALLEREILRKALKQSFGISMSDRSLMGRLLASFISRLLVGLVVFYGLAFLSLGLFWEVMPEWFHEALRLTFIYGGIPLVALWSFSGQRKAHRYHRWVAETQDAINQALREALPSAIRS